MPTTLSPRLLSAVPYVREGDFVADVGTDHAYLPIYLCESGRICPRKAGALCAVASDINKGPVERATVHIAAAGLTASILTVQTDGLCGLDRYDPDTVIIFGMGGELIAAILAAAPWLRRDGRRLILQPMTHAERLRAYLVEGGFAIIGETLSQEGERVYQTICAEPAALPALPLPALSPAALAVGEACHRRGDPAQMDLWQALIRKTLATETAARDARRGAGVSTPASDALIDALHALLLTHFQNGDML